MSTHSLNKTASTAELADGAHSQGQAKGPRLMDKSWEVVQKKTFTKWVNTELKKGGVPPVEDLATDFCDGVKLLQLLEVIGNENLGKYYKAPKIRVQKCENMNKALAFIKSRGVNLTNIGAEDLVDKNEKLVLGLIWTLILRFTIAEISLEGLSAKEGLLLWCQRKTAGYKNVSVKDFTFSWADGLALCALIHRHRPDLIPFDTLQKLNKSQNVQLALETAENKLGIAKLLDVEDLAEATKPDERSVMTYVAQYFHTFSAYDKVEVAGRRVGKFVNVLQATWDMQNDYEKRAKVLLAAFEKQTQDWSAVGFDGTYANAKAHADKFAQHKVSSKRSWVTEKRELSTVISNIITKQRTYNLAIYSPPEGLRLQNIEDSWAALMESESSHRKSINNKLREIKEDLRHRFSKLANEFESDLNEITLQIGALDGDLQEQLDQVRALQTRVKLQDDKLADVKEVDGLCLAAGLDDTDREYTVFSLDDLNFDLGLVKMALQKKQGFIENQIVARNMTNLTPQQLEEFETTFKTFDKDGSNGLSDYEFRACLQALGNNYEDAEFAALFKRVSDGAEVINFEQFSKYMVSITEDRTSRDQLLQSFKSISGGKDFVTLADMHTGGIPPEQAEYLKNVMPKVDGKDDAYDFNAYLSRVFSS